ncbi:MAG: hypothetical protein ACE5EG_12060, partial [Thermoanaerobaculia bacterium]
MSDEKEPAGDQELKVTDKRMFTAEGELREEYRHLDGEAETVAESAPEVPVREPAAEPPPPAPEPALEPPPSETEPASGPPPEASEPATDAPPEDAPRLEIPGTPEELGAPGFLDLVTLLAEPIALYLGDVELPDGKSAENLEMARLHI